MSPASAFTGDRYVLKKRLLRLLADGFSIQDDAGREVLSARQKRFRLREDIRLQDATGQEVLGIFARSIIDFAASYDVVDLASDARLCTFRRREIRSLVRDTWELAGPEGEPWGGIVEDSVALSLVRRFATNLVPQRYDLTADGRKVADLSQNFNPFTYHLQIDFHVPPPAFDRRLGLAGAVLLGVFEGRQSREG